MQKESRSVLSLLTLRSELVEVDFLRNEPTSAFDTQIREVLYKCFNRYRRHIIAEKRSCNLCILCLILPTSLDNANQSCSGIEAFIKRYTIREDSLVRYPQI